MPGISPAELGGGEFSGGGLCSQNLSEFISSVKENILYSKVAETKSVCHYYLNSRSCPYEKVDRSTFQS